MGVLNEKRCKIEEGVKMDKPRTKVIEKANEKKIKNIHYV